MCSDNTCWFIYFFFFQAEDGIRDYKVTGVQTCALPICADPAAGTDAEQAAHPGDLPQQRGMGPGRIWRGGCSPPLLSQERLTAQRGRGRTPGRDAAPAQTLREEIGRAHV